MTEQSTPSASAPACIEALNLSPGRTTRRRVECCTEDDGHTVISDAWVRWDEMLQEHVFDSDMGNPMCQECDGALVSENIDVLNAVAIRAAREALVKLIHDLRDRLAQPPAIGEAAWVRKVCSHCASNALLGDAYASFDPILNRGEVQSVFPGAHHCPVCDGEARAHKALFSNHELLALHRNIARRIEGLQAELVALDAWIAAEGPRYGLDAPPG